MPDASSSDRNRQFAREIVERLRRHGYEAYWAGGCVRDALLGRTPKDYDVATNARPEEVRDVFGHRLTLPIGMAFGVITVRGERGVLPVEVATFRRDVGYSDGRHPDGVVFSSAAEDAQRRDFTINGMFFDPIAESVVDFVGGRQDLADGVVRAIRDPRERFHEDKLRMLRAIRFAATFGFELERNTLFAIRELAREIVIVSAERIAAEMRRILPHSSRRRGVELLSASWLLPVIIPELAPHDPEAESIGPPAERLPSGGTPADRSFAINAAGPAAPAAARLDNPWSRTLELLERLHNPSFPAALAALIHTVADEGETRKDQTPATKICRRLKLSLEEITRTSWLLANARQAIAGPACFWPRLQPLLASAGGAELVDYAESLAQAERSPLEGIAYCREKLALPPEILDPPPLIDGESLKRMGFAPGPQFRVLLEAVRDRQLLGELRTNVEALEFVRHEGQRK
jgi:tRNA nucleotidyltransferase/poly(A) polymerase